MACLHLLCFGRSDLRSGQDLNSRIGKCRAALASHSRRPSVADIECSAAIATPKAGDSMKAAGPNADQTEIDLVDLLERVDNDRDLLRELLEIFNEKAPSYMEIFDKRWCGRMPPRPLRKPTP